MSWLNQEHWGSNVAFVSPVDRDRVTRPQLQRRSWLPILAVALVGMSLSLTAFFVAARWERERIEAAFTLASRNETAAIRRQMTSEIEVIRAMEAFYSASELVERHEFRLFAAALLSDHPAIRALEWVPQVPGDQREAFEQALLAEGVNSVPFKELSPSGAARPVSPRDAFFPVVYVEPLTGNEQALGFDLGSEPLRKQALDAAAQSGQIIAAGPIRLIQEMESANGLLMFQAIYGPVEQESPAPVAISPMGFVVAVVSVDKIVEQALGSLQREPMDVYLLDMSAPPEKKILHTHAFDPSHPSIVWLEKAEDADELRQLHHLEEFTLAGKSWGVMTVATPSFSRIRQNWHHWGVGYTGIALTLLLTAYLISIAGRADVAELALAAHQDELHLARRVQVGLLPESAPKIHGIDIAGASYPATQVSGDHFDFINVDNERLGIVIGDASGHGLGAAMLMVEIRACLRTAVGHGEKVGDILSVANRVLSEGMLEDRFITLLLATIDPVRRALVYANAGHPTGIVLDSHGRMKQSLTSTSIPIGIDDSEPFPSSEAIQLEDGDLVLLLTDGVLEAMSRTGEMFGEQRTLEVVRDHRHEPAARIIDHLHAAILHHCSGKPPHDDITVVIIKIEDPSAATAHVDQAASIEESYAMAGP